MSKHTPSKRNGKKPRTLTSPFTIGVVMIIAGVLFIGNDAFLGPVGLPDDILALPLIAGGIMIVTMSALASRGGR